MGEKYKAEEIIMTQQDMVVNTLGDFNVRKLKITG